MPVLRRLILPLGEQCAGELRSPPLVHVDYIKQYAARLEYIRGANCMLPPLLPPPLPHLPMAERCEELLYLRAQFNMPDIAETTPGWLDRGSSLFYRLTPRPYVLLRAPGVRWRWCYGGGDHTVRICHSGFHAPLCVPRAPRH